MKNFIFILFLVFQASISHAELPLYYWQKKGNQNFGDHLSLKLVERIVGDYVATAQLKERPKLLAIGSILILANDGDVIWGTGMNGKRMDLKLYKFDHLDVRAVRGPMTRDFLIKNFNIDCPETYGDPALLFPYLFPEFKKQENPQYDYIVIPHYSDEDKFPKDLFPNVVHPTEPWDKVIRKILNSKYVISGSLHGLIIAEAYGIPAQYLRVTDHEPLYKFTDYYLGTGRSSFNYATSIEEALNMVGEPPCSCDVEKLYYSFPFEYWPDVNFKYPNFN